MSHGYPRGTKQCGTRRDMIAGAFYIKKKAFANLNMFHIFQHSHVIPLKTIISEKHFFKIF